MKKTFTLLLMLLMSGMAFSQVSTWDGTWEPWTHGTGTESDPFLIENAQQLAYLAYQVNNGFGAGSGHIVGAGRYYNLTVDVNLNGNTTLQWTPIGYWNSDADYYAFGGHFDGNNHIISGVFIENESNRVGFFGFVCGATIENFVLKGTKIKTTQTAGGIVGISTGTTVLYNLQNHVDIVGITSGGIIGYSEDAMSIADCNNFGNVSANIVGGNAGGITGSNKFDWSTRISINNCHNSGVIAATETNSRAGGIYGNLFQASLMNCRNTGSVMAYTHVGGIGGAGNENTVSDCYNTGNLAGNVSGGILGYLSGNVATITNCYNTGGSVAQPITGGIIGARYGYSTIIVTNSYYINTSGGNNSNGGDPKTEAFMKDMEFVILLNNGSLTYKQDVSPFANQGYPVFSGLNLETLMPSSVTCSSAILKGSYAEGVFDITIQGFEYKKSSETDYVRVNIAAGQTPFSYNLRNLEGQTTYQYRAFATAMEGTSYGQLVEFTTPEAVLYTITATVVGNGTISPSGTIQVVEGHNKTFTITPDPGFEIAALIVDNDTIEPVSTYIFSNVTSNHTIKASFTEMTGPCLPPLNLIVNVIDATSVRMSWQGGADAYAIAYGVNGNYNHTAVTMENSITIEGLLSQANYVWKIKSLCGELETDYVEGQPFTTSGHGINENGIVFGMCPNPAHETLTITGSDMKLVEIFNVLGQKAFSEEVNKETVLLNVSGLNVGLYLVKITDAYGNVGVEKLIVK